MNASEPTVDRLFDLSGCAAIVTGASGHLGKALAAALAEAGCRVVVGSRDLRRAEETAAGLPEASRLKHFGVVLDHTDPESIAAGFDRATRLADGVDILVNNGHAPLSNDWTNVTFAEFARHQENAAGYFELARHLRNHLVQRQASGSVIMVGSMYGQVASYPDAYQNLSPASPVAYHALKGGILQMTRHLAVYWAKDRVRVNSLSPGAFPRSDTNSELIERLNKKIPMGRIGRPSELKGAVVFLASEASSYMTGQNLVIDGGWTAW